MSDLKFKYNIFIDGDLRGACETPKELCDMIYDLCAADPYRIGPAYWWFVDPYTIAWKQDGTWNDVATLNVGYTKEFNKSSLYDIMKEVNEELL